jgi:hypothetical protein
MHLQTFVCIYACTCITINIYAFFCMYVYVCSYLRMDLGRYGCIMSEGPHARQDAPDHWHSGSELLSQPSLFYNAG